CIDLYVVGDTTLQQVAELVNRHFRWRRPENKSYHLPEVRPFRGEVKRVVEQMDVGQGKLNLGLRTGILHASDAYPAALMYNGIFGSYPHSKLFINVREKASLAYY